MGTGWRVRAVAPDTDGPGADEARGRLRAAVLEELGVVIEQMSTWEPASLISRFNAAPAGTWMRVPSAFAAVLEAGLAMAARSDGAFDPCMGSCVDLWGFGPAGRPQEAPGAAETDAALSASGARRLRYDAPGRRLRQPGGLRLDFSGVAKGYAVDAVSARLVREGARAHFVEIGGECRGEGVKPDGLPWWVRLENPPAEESGADPGEIVVALCGWAVATSGDYVRAWRAGGETCAHTIDPQTGAPARGLAAVTAIAPTAMEADALATALSAMGEMGAGRAYDWARAENIAARLVERSAGGLRERLTPAFAAMLD